MGRNPLSDDFEHRRGPRTPVIENRDSCQDLLRLKAQSEALEQVWNFCATLVGNGLPTERRLLRAWEWGRPELEPREK